MTTSPGTKSQENGLKQGFALLYVRALHGESLKPGNLSRPIPSKQDMTRVFRLLLLIALAVGFGHWAPLSGAQRIERRLERSFNAAARSIVLVRISGGPITVETGPAARFS